MTRICLVVLVIAAASGRLLGEGPFSGSRQLQFQSPTSTVLQVTAAQKEAAARERARLLAEQVQRRRADSERRDSVRQKSRTLLELAHRELIALNNAGDLSANSNQLAQGKSQNDPSRDTVDSQNKAGDNANKAAKKSNGSPADDENPFTKLRPNASRSKTGTINYQEGQSVFIREETNDQWKPGKIKLIRGSKFFVEFEKDSALKVAEPKWVTADFLKPRDADGAASQK